MSASPDLLPLVFDRPEFGPSARVAGLHFADRQPRVPGWWRHGYLGVGLALPHQLWTGKDFLTSPAATVFWWTMWGAAAGSALIWRFGQPLWRSLRHQLVVDEVRAENALLVQQKPVTTVVMRGRNLHRLPVLAGQFFQWRFLDGPGFTRAHPYSLSAAPDGRTLRITAAHLGEGSARLASLRQLVPEVANHDVFICGGPGWMAAADRAVIGAGVPREHVHIERFTY